MSHDSPQLDLRPVPTELDDRCQVGNYRDLDGNTHVRCEAPWAIELQDIPVQGGQFREFRVCKLHHLAMKALGFVNRTKRRLTPKGSCRGFKRHRPAGDTCARCGKQLKAGMSIQFEETPLDFQPQGENDAS